MNFKLKLFIPFPLFCLFGLHFANAAIPDSISNSSRGSVTSISIGLVFQKAAGFYWSNGFSAEIRKGKKGDAKIGFGLSYVNSRLGTAMNSHAIPFYEINGFGTCYFRKEKSFNYFLRLSAGYAHANMGSEIFRDIQNQSPLSALSAGLVYDFKFPLQIGLSGGFNFFTGNGMKGLGVIYPAYVQYKISYRFLLGKKKS